MIRYENDSTDIFDAVPRYEWALAIWPVALVGQKQPTNPHVLVRFDYDQRGILRGYSTTLTNGPVAHGAVPKQVTHEWPDLKGKKVVALAQD